MKNEELEKILSREMTSGDRCNQRILKCIPMFHPIICSYMLDHNNYRYSSVFMNVIIDWNNERILDIKEKYKDHENQLHLAIDEVITFYEQLKKIKSSYDKNKTLSISQDLINAMQLKHFKEISTLCRIYKKDEKNYSKLVHRVCNFRTKAIQFLRCKYTLDRLISEEVIPQLDFLSDYVTKMMKYDLNQFPIFLLAHDIRKIR